MGNDDVRNLEYCLNSTIFLICSSFLTMWVRQWTSISVLNSSILIFPQWNWTAAANSLCWNQRRLYMKTWSGTSEVLYKILLLPLCTLSFFSELATQHARFEELCHLHSSFPVTINYRSLRQVTIWLHRAAFLTVRRKHDLFEGLYAEMTSILCLYFCSLQNPPGGKAFRVFAVVWNGTLGRGT